MKKYEWNRTESNDIEMVESPEGIYVLWSDVKPLIEALKSLRLSEENINRLDQVNCETRKMIILHGHYIATEALKGLGAG